MGLSTENAIQGPSVWPPKALACYRNGWRQMWKYILELLLVVAIFPFINAVGGLPSGLLERLVRVQLGIIPDIFGILSLAFFLLITLPINYGIAFVYLKAARGDQVEIKDMLAAFHNYLNAVLAGLLVSTIVVIGLAFLLVPGIIFACRLAFTPYLIVDRRMKVIDAVKGSWHMSRGYARRVFFIGLLAIPVCIAGLICFIVGIMGAIMLIGLAFASLYHAVSVLEGLPRGSDIPRVQPTGQEVERLQQELEDARQMQLGLLPESSPLVEGLDIAGFSRPAREVGGDFFDYFSLSDGRIGIAIADISGKGLKGAMNAVLTNGMLHEVARNAVSCSEILLTLNRGLYSRMEKHMFVTLGLAALDRDGRTLQWASAAQPYPIVKHGEKIFELEGDNGLPLGIKQHVSYPDRELVLQIGDIIVFYTDGIIEGENESEEMYQIDRLKQSIEKVSSAMNAEEIIESILQDVASFVGAVEQYDDMTIVVVKKSESESVN
ncbi:PP2C family protein-serine/threonine phosphatase [Candidatus Poribacteria bacterium]